MSANPQSSFDELSLESWEESALDRTEAITDNFNEQARGDTVGQSEQRRPRMARRRTRGPTRHRPPPRAWNGSFTRMKPHTTQPTRRHGRQITTAAMMGRACRQVQWRAGTCIGQPYGGRGYPYEASPVDPARLQAASRCDLRVIA